MRSVVDMHTHVLPGIDDGSRSVKESIAMLRLEAKQGIRQVIATPHFYAQHDRPKAFLQRRNEAEAKLREEMTRHKGLPELLVGAEVYYYRGMSRSEILPELAIRGTGCILVEMPQPPWTDRMYRELEEIHSKLGLTPIVAHVDRYIRPFRTYGIPARLEELPVLVQANGSFFLRRSTAGMALRMLKRDQIHLLGSDCHNQATRTPNLAEAVAVIERRLGGLAIERIGEYEREVLGSAETVRVVNVHI